ncbi:MAG: FMN-binding protein [Calditrichaeota bacterium]|nr:MAG: FMN-binding protein [Calditrichota bacterium]
MNEAALFTERRLANFSGRAGGVCSVPMLWLVLAALVLVRALPAGAQQEQTRPAQPTFVYLTPDEALQEAFPKAARFRVDTLRLSLEQRRALAKKLRQPELDSLFIVHLAYNAEGHFLGYATIMNEVGKYEPITFVVGVDPRFRVKKVAVMVYRESRGGQVRQPRFLYQFRNKSARDPLQPGRDIINISGATLSVRAISRGVKKALHILSFWYGTHPPQGGRRSEP